MNETRIASPIPGVPGRAPRMLDIQRSATLFAGGYEKKQFLEGTAGDRPISLIERPMDEFYIEHWKAFKEVGFPVVPMLRQSENNTLLVTDVKADGSEVYGKGLRIMVSEHRKQRTRPRPDVDRRFLALMSSESFKETLSERLRNYAVTATRNNMGLATDDPFELVVRPDGKWKIMMLDLRYARISGIEYPSDHTKLPIDDTNKRAVKKFEEDLSRLAVFLDPIRGDYLTGNSHK